MRDTKKKKRNHILVESITSLLCSESDNISYYFIN